jgi:hypothetical protein
MESRKQAWHSAVTRVLQAIFVLWMHSIWSAYNPASRSDN